MDATQFEPDAARLLLQSGAAVNARTNEGRTALMQAIDGPKDFDNERHGVYSPEIAKLLIAAGADVNAHDVSGNTALSLAIKRGYQDMIRFDSSYSRRTYGSGHVRVPVPVKRLGLLANNSRDCTCGGSSRLKIVASTIDMFLERRCGPSKLLPGTDSSIVFGVL